MTQRTPTARGPVEIAPRIHWVGKHLEGDPFQCHTYLIEHGDQSVLIDPGSVLTFAQVFENVERILPFSKIRYFICQHPDPDIIGAMPQIDALIQRPDAVLITHWRAATLLEHQGLKMPFWNIESHGWQLDLGGRRLSFVFTPYLHFPGAYCTFDATSGTLFSSDLFGGFTSGDALYAEDEGYFEEIRAFHEHYMPSREILMHGLLRLEQQPIKQIAPQHGRIIPERLVRPIIERLKGMECGLYLMARGDTDIHRLMRLNSMLRDVMQTLVLHRELSSVATFLLARARELLPVDALGFYVGEGGEEIAYFGEENRFHADIGPAPGPVRRALSAPRGVAPSAHHQLIPGRAFEADHPDQDRILVPLSTDSGAEARAIAVFRLTRPLTVSDELDDVLGQLAVPLGIAVEREALYGHLERERDKLYELSIRDALTGLYTRRYLDDAGRRMVERHERDDAADVATIMLDVDHFKQVNDTHGHSMGDTVLKAVAATLQAVVRAPDVVGRYGGEEFSIVAHVRDASDAERIADRIREAVAREAFAGATGPFAVTISAGVALHHRGESLAACLKRADHALYAAKTAGRNRTCLAA